MYERRNENYFHLPRKELVPTFISETDCICLEKLVDHVKKPYDGFCYLLSTTKAVKIEWDWWDQKFIYSLHESLLTLDLIRRYAAK